MSYGTLGLALVDSPFGSGTVGSSTVNPPAAAATVTLPWQTNPAAWIGTNYQAGGGNLHPGAGTGGNRIVAPAALVAPAPGMISSILAWLLDHKLIVLGAGAAAYFIFFRKKAV